MVVCESAVVMLGRTDTMLVRKWRLALSESSNTGERTRKEFLSANIREKIWTKYRCFRGPCGFQGESILLQFDVQMEYENEIASI